jgi:hypothetical protein
MMEYWILQLRLRALERVRRQGIKGGREMMMKEEGMSAEDAEVLADTAAVNDFVDEQVRYLIGRYLLDEANRLIITTPAREENGPEWVQSRYSDRWLLSDPAINDLRAKIRAEKKARAERVLMWLPVVGAITGLLGVLTGLVAVWGRH